MHPFDGKDIAITLSEIKKKYVWLLDNKLKHDIKPHFITTWDNIFFSSKKFALNFIEKDENKEPQNFWGTQKSTEF